MKKLLTKKFGIYSAIGVAGGMTFGTTSAEADIIFTDVSGTASQGNPLSIDLDGDTVTDFIFDLTTQANGYGSLSNWAAISAQGANQFAATAPAPFAAGASYGPNNLAFGGSISGQSFAGGSGPLQLAYLSYNPGNIYGAFGGSNFPTDPSGYIGVQFATGGGDTVFGWIGVTVSGDVTDANFANATIDIDGFAYATGGETITAGQTSSIPEPNSLGLLALGAAGLAVRRRKNIKV